MKVNIDAIRRRVEQDNNNLAAAKIDRAALLDAYDQTWNQLTEAHAELEATQSFDGILAQIDKWYPLDAPYFRDGTDPGCVAMRAARQATIAAKERDELRSRIATLERQLAEARAVLKGYEQWEAGVLMDDKCWPQGAPWPVIKEEHFDRMMELQEQRNKALAALTTREGQG